MKEIIIATVSLLFLYSLNIYAQSNLEKRLGEVTYKTSQNIYVKFENTEGISAGDTLFLEQGNTPCLIVMYLSSRSCAGRQINGKELAAGDTLIAYIKKKKETALNDGIFKNDIQKIILDSDNTIRLGPVKKQLQSKAKSDLKGRFSIQSYSNFSNHGTLSDVQRWRYSFSLNANEISGSAFSFSSYFLFSYKASDWQNVKANIGRGLKVYDFALSYKLDQTSILWLGRHLNRKIANIGSTDGIQYEKSFGNYFSGLILGSRPNFSDLGFDLKLFEYGFYIGRSDTINSWLMENVISIFQQTNNSKTDRRFIYLQHTNAVLKNTSFYASSEIDLYKREKGSAKNKLTLTSLFFSGRYSPDKFISFSLSYDARKNVIYYETFKNFADSVLENEIRQGLRAGLNIKPIYNLFINLDGGYRFRKKDTKPSRNYAGRISYSNIPVIEITPSISYSRLISSYLDGNIWGVRISKTFFSNNLSASLNYSETDYSFSNSSINLKQRSIILNAGFRFITKLFLNLSYESTFESKNTFNRILTDVSLHF